MLSSESEKARQAIGKSESDDWRIAPTCHVDRLKQSAPELAKLLAGSSVSGKAAEYEKEDSRANEAQRRFNRVSAYANFAVLVATTLATAAGLAASAGGAVLRSLAPYIAVLGALASAAGVAALYWLRAGKLLERWTSSRARAEALRLQYFAEVMADAEDAPRNSYTTFLQLEYFRRYQLEVQLSFFSGRGEQHERAARKAQLLGVAGVFLATFANALVGYSAFGSAPDPATGQEGSLAIVILSLVAAFGAALSAFAVAREGVGQHTRNAERYDGMARVLREFAGRLDKVRAAVDHGRFEALAQLVDSVHGELAAEQRAWLDQATRQESALAELDAILKKDQPPAQGPAQASKVTAAATPALPSAP